MLSLRKVSPAWFKQNVEKHLTEEYYEVDMPKLAIIAKDGRQIWSWMRCKDYINATVWAHRVGQNVNDDYGWYYNPTDDGELSDRWFNLAIKWESGDLKKAMRNVKATVENLEKRIKIPKYRRTRFSDVRDGHFLIFGAPDWMSCVETVSFFTWLIRASLNNTSGRVEEIKNPPVDKDAYYFKSGRAFLDILLKNGIKKFKGSASWNKYAAAYAVHSCGFVNFCQTKLKGKNALKNLDFDF